MSALQFSSMASVDSVYWITSLEPDEQGSTRRVHEDLIPFFDSSGVTFKYFEPKSAVELLRILRDIAIEAKHGAKPVLHFDSHGDADKGIFISSSNEFLSWSTLLRLLRKINIPTVNNLCVISAACHSLHLIKEVSVAKQTPFFLMIAPENEVSFGFMEDKTVSFYRSVFQNNDVVAAYEEHLKPQLSLFHSEKIVAIALTQYFFFNCIGESVRIRREGLMTKAIQLGVPNNRRNRRLIRSTVKAMTKPSPEIVKRYATHFLIGKSFNFRFGDLMNQIKNAQRVNEARQAQSRRLESARRRVK